MATSTTITGEVRVILSPAAVRELLQGSSGPVVRDLFVRGERVKRRAIQLAPVGKPDPFGRTRKNAPGNLRNHIVKRLVQGASGPEMQVGVEHVPYALFVHEGARPHRITARNAPQLVFFWPKVQKVIYTKSVAHPGNRPNRFLVRALDAA